MMNFIKNQIESLPGQAISTSTNRAHMLFPCGSKRGAASTELFKGAVMI